MSLINNKLHPHERAIVLRSVGLKIDRDRGQISNIRNVGYEDKRPSLCINLDTGQVKDFGAKGQPYSGDIFTLLGAILNKDFQETVRYVEDVLNQKIDDMDREVQENEYAGKSAEEIKYEQAKGFKFWNKQYKIKMQKCQKVLNDFAIQDSVKDIHEYDCIDLKTLKKFGCGYYGYPDFEFGLSDYQGDKKLFVIIPYETGAMLYRREDGEKMIRHIKGGKAGYSFFNGTGEFTKDRLIICKSPREAMLAWELFGFFCDVIGICGGESIKVLYPKQEKTLQKFISNNDNEKKVYTFFDCNKDESFETAYDFSKLVKEVVKDGAKVYMTNFHKGLGQKDLTDFIRAEGHKENIDKLTSTISQSKEIIL